MQNVVDELNAWRARLASREWTWVRGTPGPGQACAMCAKNEAGCSLFLSGQAQAYLAAATMCLWHGTPYSVLDHNDNVICTRTVKDVIAWFGRAIALAKLEAS